MQFVKKIFDFYIQSSIHVGIAVICLVQITFFSSKEYNQIHYPICIFFGTIIGYNFLKYLELFRIGKFYDKKYLGITIVTLFSVFGFIVFFLVLKIVLQRALLFCGILVLFYPFFRKQGWLKMFYVSFVVTIISVYIPFLVCCPIKSEFCISICQRFLIVISLLIPFEILDSKTDATHLRTLPQLFGVNKTKLFGIVLVVLSIFLEFFKVNPSILVFPIDTIIILFIYFSSIKKNKYYTLFWVESVPVFWFIGCLFQRII